MSRILTTLVALCSVAAAVQAQTTAQPASATTTTGPSVDETLAAVRSDLQTARADIMAKNLTLSAYQKEQNVIIDDQLKDIQKYVTSADHLDDAGALALMKAHFKRDEKMNALRQKWLGEFQKVLPTKQAVRAMQIDRRLSLAAQM